MSDVSSAVYELYANSFIIQSLYTCIIKAKFSELFFSENSNSHIGSRLCAHIIRSPYCYLPITAPRPTKNVAIIGIAKGANCIVMGKQDPERLFGV